MEIDEVWFNNLRFDLKHHLGLGDIRLTIGQQEEILAAIAEKDRRIEELEEELESHSWEISPAMAQAKIDHQEAKIKELEAAIEGKDEFIADMAKAHIESWSKQQEQIAEKEDQVMHWTKIAGARQKQINKLAKMIDEICEIGLRKGGWEVADG